MRRDEIKILLVDDESSFLEQAEAFLEKEENDFKIEKTLSAEEGLDLLEQEDFDAVVSDYKMPEIDGLEFLEALRDDGNDIPFIIFTGKGREKVAMEALNLGADRYLQKGGDPKAQFGVLAKAIIQEVKHRKTMKRLRLTKYSLEHAAVSILWITPEGRIAYANKTAIEKLGYSEEELRGMFVSEIDPNYPDERPSIWKKLKNEGTTTFKSLHRTKSGEEFPVEIKSKYLKFGDEEYEFAFATDIRRRKKAEEKFEILFDNLPDSTILIDNQGDIQEVNDTFCRLAGIEREDLVGTPIEDSLDFLPEEKKDRALGILVKELAGEKTVPHTFEVEYEGEKRVINANAIQIELEDGKKSVIAMLRDITEEEE